jgi:hypothetical protein
MKETYSLPEQETVYPQPRVGNQSTEQQWAARDPCILNPVNSKDHWTLPQEGYHTQPTGTLSVLNQKGQPSGNNALGLQPDQRKSKNETQGTPKQDHSPPWQDDNAPNLPNLRHYVTARFDRPPPTLVWLMKELCKAMTDQTDLSNLHILDDLLNTQKCILESQDLIKFDILGKLIETWEHTQNLPVDLSHDPSMVAQQRLQPPHLTQIPKTHPRLSTLGEYLFPTHLTLHHHSTC